MRIGGCVRRDNAQYRFKDFLDLVLDVKYD